MSLGICLETVREAPKPATLRAEEGWRRRLHSTLIGTDLGRNLLPPSPFFTVCNVVCGGEAAEVVGACSPPQEQMSTPSAAHQGSLGTSGGKHSVKELLAVLGLARCISSVSICCPP